MHLSSFGLDAFVYLQGDILGNLIHISPLLYEASDKAVAVLVRASFIWAVGVYKIDWRTFLTIRRVSFHLSPECKFVAAVECQGSEYQGEMHDKMIMQSVDAFKHVLSTLWCDRRHDVPPCLALYESEVGASLAISRPCHKIAFPVAEITPVRDVRTLAIPYFRLHFKIRLPYQNSLTPWIFSFSML